MNTQYNTILQLGVCIEWFRPSCASIGVSLALPDASINGKHQPNENVYHRQSSKSNQKLSC